MPMTIGKNIHMLRVLLTYPARGLGGFHTAVWNYCQIVRVGWTISSVPTITNVLKQPVGLGEKELDSHLALYPG